MRKISQEELADKLGVSRQSVSKWETGENYPSMTNIMCLCTIFKCQINELVHEDMSDINSLDEEVKMSVVKFKKQKQKKVKVLSKIISVLSKIGWIASIVGAVLIGIVAVLLPIAIKNIDIKDGKIISNNTKIIEVVEENNELIIKRKKSIIAVESDKEKIAMIKDVVEDNINNKGLLIGYCETASIVLIASLVLLILMLKRVEKLFNNIHNGDTPFTLENVEHIKKIAYLMIALIILPNVTGSIFEIILHKDLDISLEMFNLVEILIIFVISYIFEYGYEIQLDSKGKMYGDSNE
ncbi:MAG: helix-turn-helix domain-containing protein [Bacilli bacterium]|nr:helix-turn-helix domain-containing protein [Bacilli bacterium]